MSRAEKVRVHQPPPLMCANCAQPLQKASSVDEIIIVDSSNQPLFNPIIKSGRPCKTVKVKKGLFEIYNLDYLKQISDDDEYGDDDIVVVCVECSSLLHVLYKSFENFGQRRSSESYLERNIKKFSAIFDIIKSSSRSSEIDPVPDQRGTGDTTTTTLIDEAEVVTLDDEDVEEIITIEDDETTTTTPPIIGEKTITENGTTTEKIVEEGIPHDLDFDNINGHETVKNDDGDNSPVFHFDDDVGVDQLEVVVEVEVNDSTENGNNNNNKIQYEPIAVDEEPIVIDDDSMDEPQQSGLVSPLPMTHHNEARHIPSPSPLQKCPKCQHFFTESIDLVRHLYDDHAKGHVTCPIPSCQQVAGRYDEMRKHLCHHFNIPSSKILRNTRLETPTLESNTSTSPAINSTQAVKNNSPIVNYQPSSCAKESSLICMVEDFERVPGAHFTKEGGYKCRFCPCRFRIKFEVVNHLFTVHVGRSATCPICKKMFEDMTRRGKKFHLIQHVDDKPTSIQASATRLAGQSIKPKLTNPVPSGDLPKSNPIDPSQPVVPTPCFVLLN